MTSPRRPHLLMCAPEHFAVSYAINPWMDPATWASKASTLLAASQAQWRALHAKLSELGAAIDLVPPAADLPDLVFTANAAVVLDRKALLARFRHAERQREEGHFARAFHALKDAGVIDDVEFLPDGMVLEGAGDCVWDQTRRMFWMGYGPRSDAGARRSVEAAFATEVIALELADPHFYHMDTALAPLPRGEVMYVPGAFTPDGLDDIHERVPPELRIALSTDDAAALAANAVCLDDAIVLSRCGASLRRRLAMRGYHVHTSPLDAFARSGGSAFCLTLRLDRRSSPSTGRARSTPLEAAAASRTPV
jgi:N-dimethylarginine dimethylaminohydrolase